jgi:PEP-CTERM motif
MNLSDWFHSSCGRCVSRSPSLIAAPRLTPTHLLTWVARTSVGVFLLAAIGLLTRAASAAPITYTITPESLSGTPGTYSLTGTITTDGTIGTLAMSDITSWQWQLTNGITTYSETGPPNTSVSATGLTATATSLSMPFPAPVASEVVPGGNLLLQNLASTSNLEFNSGTFDTSGVEYNSYWRVAIEPAGVSFTLSDFSPTLPSGGAFVFATVPEPSTAVLFAIGAMAWAVGFARRRVRARVA